MPSGACVRVNVDPHKRFLNLNIDATAADKGNIKGLCGNFNDVPNDDFETKSGDPVICPDYASLQGCSDLAEEWRVPDDENLFNTPITPGNTNPPPNMCKCEKNPNDQDIICEPVVAGNPGKTTQAEHQLSAKAFFLTMGDCASDGMPKYPVCWENISIS